MITQRTLNLSENGWPTCPKCGGILHWNADFMASELGQTDKDDTENNDVVSCLTCPNCDSDYYYRQAGRYDLIDFSCF